MHSSLTAKEQHSELGWKIIEWKVAYYMPEAVHPSRRADYEVSDEVYDAAEVQYLTLCRDFGWPNTVVHKGWPGFGGVDHSRAMMEVDPDRPSVQLVMAKLGSPKLKPTRKRKRKK